jgi:protein-L-isoaspartate(D-aspartate) O-methyltransferase
MQRDEFETDRAKLVDRVRKTTGITDERVLQALMRVPRHCFVPPAELFVAHEDRALPLSENQTISQPSMVAIMLDALRCSPEDRALEVGAGSGYAAALLAQLVAEVDAIEIRPLLAERARQTLASLGIDNVHVYARDGSQGMPERAPFQRILVSAGAASLPERLVDQLAPGGRIAIPIGNEVTQTLRVGERRAGGEVHWEDSVPCMFVPLVEA